MGIFQRAGLFFLALYFFWAAALQYNDPDPAHWILLYVFTGALCLLALMQRSRPGLICFAMGMCALQLTIVADGAYAWLGHGAENFLTTPMSPEKAYIEEVREFVGTLIALGAQGWMLWLTKRRQHTSPTFHDKDHNAAARIRTQRN